MAVQVKLKGKEVGDYVAVVVNGYYEMTTLEFIADRVNDYRKRLCATSHNPGLEVYKIRVPSRPEPNLNRS